MKFRRCENCYHILGSHMDCVKLCGLTLDILHTVEEYFNNPNTYPEDLESDLYDIVESEGEDG